MEPREGRSVYGDWRTAAMGEGGLQRSEFEWLTRPMTPYEMIDDGVALYREHFPLLAKLSFLIYLIPTLVTVLFLVPIAVAEWRSPASSPVAAFLECGSLCLLFPYLVIAPPFQAMATSWAAYRFLQGEPVNSLREVWDAVRPRLGQLIANQLLAFMVLGLIYVVIGVMTGIGAVAGAMAIGSLGLGGTASLIMLMLFYLLGTIVLLLLTALATVWVIILPQIILFEPETDALTAFSRAFTLVGKNFRHAFVSCLLFWAFQGVVYLSAYMFLGLVVLTVAGLLYAYGVDLQALYMRWANTFGNLVDVVSYVVFALVYPAMYLISFFFYFDLRYRAEGLDIAQVLARSGKG